MTYDLPRALSETSDRVAAELDRLLPKPEDQLEKELFEAMRYSALAGGKRLRPFLVVHSANLFNVSPTAALRTACAIEMVHTYSLIHDDLPAMDDDDMRRGKPSCHKQFNEATAILAGDALLTQAFELLSNEATHSDPNVRLQLIQSLSRAAGPLGMVGGQMMDLVAEGADLGQQEFTRLHMLKTGRIFGFCCEAGALLGKAPRSLHNSLHAYANGIGLAFQIQDDILDVEGDEEALGKTAGKDADADKATWVKVLGLETARQHAQMLVHQAVSHLSVFDDAKAAPLAAVANFIVDRDR